jgi:predicted transposase YbfD/YdcC
VDELATATATATAKGTIKKYVKLHELCCKRRFQRSDQQIAKKGVLLINKDDQRGVIFHPEVLN